MKQLNVLILLFWAGIILGCAQKLPVNTGDDVGMLAIAMMGQKTGRGEFIFSYELSHSTAHEARINIVPGAGEKFIFSDVLPAGEYEFDTVTMYAKPTINTLSPINKESQRLGQPVSIHIEPGKISLLPALLRVHIKPGDAEEFYQEISWVGLDEQATEMLKKRLGAMENAGGWQI